MISAVSMLWPDLGTSPTYLFAYEFCFAVGLRCSRQCVFQDSEFHVHLVSSVTGLLCLNVCDLIHLELTGAS